MGQAMCDRAPEGWLCRRGAGHEGPCAAVFIARRSANVPTEPVCGDPIPACYDSEGLSDAVCELPPGHDGPHRVEWT